MYLSLSLSIYIYIHIVDLYAWGFSIIVAVINGISRIFGGWWITGVGFFSCFRNNFGKTNYWLVGKGLDSAVPSTSYTDLSR